VSESRATGSKTQGRASLASASVRMGLTCFILRSEFRNALAGALRQKLITIDAANDIIDNAESHFTNRDFAVSSRAVLNLVASSTCSAYDCEFVALVEEQRVELVTLDRQILRDFPRIAVSLGKFTHP
jgi:predicted nucleic acid-binding protein